jgi:thiamine pyrophosphokinase
VFVRALILTGGDPVDAASLDRVQPGWRSADLVIAADGGARQAAALGLTLHQVIGDFDSLTSAEYEALVAAGVRCTRFPVEKEATDTELALLAALDAGVSEIALIGVWGGRVDHALGIAALLEHPRVRASGALLVLLGADSVVRLLAANERCELLNHAGQTLSLIPWGADATVSISGTRWPLTHETLHVGASRGLSNVATSARVVLTVHSGKLLLVSGVPA